MLRRKGKAMIRRAEECSIEYREHMRDGEGTVELKSLIASPEELNNKGRLFSKITLRPGTSIGYHLHDKDTELFYFLSGTGEYNGASEGKNRFDYRRQRRDRLVDRRGVS